jgi:hypothetical protein
MVKLKTGVKRILTASLKIGFGFQVVVTMTTPIYTLGMTSGTPCLF